MKMKCLYSRLVETYSNFLLGQPCLTLLIISIQKSETNVLVDGSMVG